MLTKEYLITVEDQKAEDGTQKILKTVELIRCKDCANYAPCKANAFNIQGICMRMNQPTDEMYFCADGVKHETVYDGTAQISDGGEA